MKLGEVCLMTNDVIRLADFCKKLLGADNGSNDPYHQFIISGETALTVCFDGAEIIEPPAKRPWGAVNFSFCDPDDNIIYFRSFPQDTRDQEDTQKNGTDI